MTTVANSTQTAIKLRRSVDTLFSCLLTLQDYADQTQFLRGRGASALSNNMVTLVKQIKEMKHEFVSNINSLYGDGYLETTYSSILAEERLLLKQKRPAECLSDNTSDIPSTKKSKTSILIHPNLRNRKRANVVTPPKRLPVEVNPPPTDSYYTPRETCELLCNETDVHVRVNMIDKLVNRKYIPILKPQVYKLLRKHKESGYVPELWGSSGRPRFMDRKDILSFAENYFETCSGRSMSEANIKKECNN